MYFRTYIPHQHSILLKGAAVHLAILVTLCLACQWSHLVQLLLKMYTKQSLEWVWVWFVLFCDTLSQKGHLLSCMTILVPNLQIIRSDIRPHIKCVVRLVTAHGHFNLPKGIVWVCMSPHTHFIPAPPPRAQMTHLMKHTSNYFIKCACKPENIHSSSALDGHKV